LVSRNTTLLRDGPKKPCDLLTTAIVGTLQIPLSFTQLKSKKTRLVASRLWAEEWSESHNAINPGRGVILTRIFRIHSHE
jgi:hypothetical protein